MVTRASTTVRNQRSCSFSVVCQLICGIGVRGPKVRGKTRLVLFGHRQKNSYRRQLDLAEKTKIFV